MNVGEHQSITMTREQAREILKRFRGEARRLAKELGVRPSAITNWFNGASSQRVERAVLARVMELLEDCKDPEKLCVPCLLRPVCEQLARRSRSGSGGKSVSRRHR